MTVQEIQAKSILRKHKKIDSWFISHYGMNLYRGCAHNCVYCDGRAEKYYVTGEFGCHVTVKTNAVEVLKKELGAKKRRPLKKSYLLLGGGVGDSYQPLESQYQLSRQVLQLALLFHYPVHILTKSTLVLRDMDLLQQIHRQSGVLVSFSMCGVDKEVCRIFEPGVPSPLQRLEAVQELQKHGIPTGVFLMPVIPFVTDMPESIQKAMQQFSAFHAEYVIFAGMTLKDGRQKEYLMNVLRTRYPEHVPRYMKIYTTNPWGQAIPKYYEYIHGTFSGISRHYDIPARIPLKFFQHILDDNDLVIVLLEQMDYLLNLTNQPSRLGYAAYAVSQLSESIRHEKDLTKIKGINTATAALIQEILRTGTCELYEKLLRHSSQ